MSSMEGTAAQHQVARCVSPGTSDSAPEPDGCHTLTVSTTVAT
jgi:hypothetical protein